ncbi:MAG TPA: hypothetical protein VMW35_22010 [Myxococcota bacterium]|jgi:hypothetical protein|nr:hypothetical protein [Myxococcota bacterium]
MSRTRDPSQAEEQRVLEILLMLAVVAVLGAWALLGSTLPVATVLFGGIWLVVAGLALGVPTGAIYHVALWRSLGRAKLLPARWWLHPTSLHDRIPEPDRLHVLAWCYLGAAGFLLTLLGCAVVAIGAWRSA